MRANRKVIEKYMLEANKNLKDKYL